MTNRFEICEIRPPANLKSFFGGKVETLWSLGDSSILSRRLLGIVSARQTDSDLALKSSQLLKQLALPQQAAFIGGWHSPLEKEALKVVLAAAVPLVFCIPKALDRFVMSVDMENRVNDRQALLLTHCSPKAQRITRDASIRRNQMVAGLAGALLVLSAPAGSSSLSLAKLALRHGKPVLTPEHRMNQELLAYSALPATLDNIRTALR